MVMSISWTGQELRFNPLRSRWSWSTKEKSTSIRRSARGRAYRPPGPRHGVIDRRRRYLRARQTDRVALYHGYASHACSGRVSTVRRRARQGPNQKGVGAPRSPLGFGACGISLHRPLQSQGSSGEACRLERTWICWRSSRGSTVISAGRSMSRPSTTTQSGTGRSC